MPAGTSKRLLKKSIANFLENLSFLIGCGYTAYEATEWVISSASIRKRDSEARTVVKIGKEILGDLSEGYSLSSAMLNNPKYFKDYAKQIEAAEESGHVADVLDQIVQNIKENESLTRKIRSAMIYPIVVLVITFGIAWYLFSFVIPDVLEMLVDAGGAETPPLTLTVMAFTGWLSKFGLPLLVLIIAGIIITIFLSKGPLRMQFNRLYTRLPFIGKITEASNVTIWMKSMKYMLSAGSPIALAMGAAADSMTNLYMKKKAKKAYDVYYTSGIPVVDALKQCEYFTAMELGTMNIGLESGRIVDVLDRLSMKRKVETEQAISTFIALLNPAVICILGVIVGIIVMAVYGPLLSITQTIK